MRLKDVGKKITETTPHVKGAAISLKTGVYKDLSNKDYHEWPGLSKSALVKIDQSPAHYMVGEDKATPVMNLGSGAHTAILEPEKFESEYLVLPEGVNLTHTEGKEKKKQAEEEGKTLLKHRDLVRIKSMAKAVNRHPEASLILSRGHPELSFFWKHAEFPDVLCKCRPDWWREDHSIVADLKTTTDARREVFQRVLNNMKYHWSVSWTTDGVMAVTKAERIRYAFIVVETEPPHGVRVYFPSDDMINIAREEIRPVVEQYEHCILNNHWPCYPQEAETIDLPPWAKKKG